MKNYKIQGNKLISEAEKILDGSNLSYDAEQDVYRDVFSGKQNNAYPYTMEGIPNFAYDFLKTYLYGLNTGAIVNKRLKIISFVGVASAINPIATAPQISGYNEDGLAVVENRFVIADMMFDGSRYQVTVFLIATDSGRYVISIKYYMSVLGVEQSATKITELIDYLTDESLRNSMYKNKIINISFDSEGKPELKQIDNKLFQEETMDKVFIPDTVRAELIKFHKCVENYDELGCGLRYILCGEPGTGKTKSLRTLINMCYGKATVIMIESTTRFRQIFEIARVLSPAIICFDDLDLLVGIRERMYEKDTLGDFLQQLDGFEKNNVFLLCTTNDKELIDKAASRPGRFDLVLDFGKINKDNYIEIIKSNCSDEAILNLFDKELLEDLRKKKVTGAFIVNLIKQLDIQHKIEPACDLKEYLNNIMEISYRGFYEQYKDEQTKIEFGFSNNGYGK